MKEIWTIHNKRADFKRIGEMLNIDPVLVRIARNRGILTDAEFEEYFKKDINSLHSPYLLKDVEKGADLLIEAIRLKKKIRIVGDYDNDGIQSTYILYKALQNIDANVDYVIPDRIKDGYGLNPAIIETAVTDKVDFILTCDNGIAADEAIALARTNNMTVVVTDHHEVPYREDIDGSRFYKLPYANAIIDPKREDCNYPFKELCGAAVAWKFLMVVYEKACQDVSKLNEFIENVAFATVCDVMDLIGENRVLVSWGLNAIHNTHNIGLKALMRVNGLEMENISAYHFGFILGPCMNATGRLETAYQGVELLLCKDIEKANELAEHLYDLNAERKYLTEIALGAAIEQVENSSWKNQKVYVVYIPDCHESICGIVAGKLRERYNRPSIVLSDGERCVKGSGRSIEKYSMFEELTKCNDLFLGFGGHPMAAGMSLTQENIWKLREQLNKNCTLTDDDILPHVEIDLNLPFYYISEDFVNGLSLLEPFGKANSKPNFVEKHVKIKSMQRIGKEKDTLKFLFYSSDGIFFPALLFHGAEQFISDVVLSCGTKEEHEMSVNNFNHIELDIIFYPQINIFNNNKSLQLIISHYRVHPIAG